MSNKKKKKPPVPKLRFAEFKDSSAWKIKSFSELYSFKSTNSLSRDKLSYESGVVKNIHYGDIHTKFSTLFDIEHEDVPFISPFEELGKIKSDSYCVEGDMIFADASEDLNDIGKSIEIFRLHGQKVLSGLHTLLARQKTRKLVIGFGGHLFKSNSIRKQIQKESQGAKVLGISAGRLSDIQVYYPSNEDEQQKIVDCLSSLDAVISLQGQKLGALREYKKGLMQCIFPREGQFTPRLRFRGFKGGWKIKKVSDLELNVTAGATPDTSNSKYWNGNIRWMNSGELNLKKVYEVENRITDQGLKKSSTKMLPKFCVLIGLAGQGKTRGTVAMNMVELCTNQSIAAIHPSKNINGDFLYHELDGRYEELRRISAGDGGRGGLNLQHIKDLDIVFPIEINEQKKVADCLSSLDEVIAAECKKLDTLKEHKKGLMQQLFPVLENADE